MGLYSWIEHYCCGEEIQFQTKDGPKDWGSYNLNDVPIQAAYSLDGQEQSCNKCGRLYTLQMSSRPPSSVKMEIV